MGLKQCCREEVIAVTPDTSVLEVAKIMEQKNVGSVVVVSGERPVGIITDRDLVVRIFAQGKSHEGLSAQDVMTKDLVTLTDATGIYEAIEQITDLGIRRMPLVDNSGRLIGIITLDDIIRLIGKEMANIAKNLETQSPPMPQ
jgi:CBS domain-containing protein